MNFYTHVEATPHGVVQISTSEKLLRIREYPVWERKMQERFPDKDRSFEKFITEWAAINGASKEIQGEEEKPLSCGC